jgi:hypothetical protein
MRRRTLNASETNISLFPFLAVLICTMGVLILLLVIASHAADESERARAAAVAVEDEEQFASLENDLALSELKTNALLSARDRKRRELQQARLRRAVIEQELGALQTQFDDAQRQAANLAAVKQLDPGAIEADLETARHNVQLAEAEWTQVRTQLASQPTLYCIVPHQSIHGTRRRPIYLECTADQVVLQPSGISIALDELSPPLLPGNPLETALITVRNYWSKYHIAGDQGEPYPLLIVRPDGARAYALARRAMQNWDDEFGYELIEADKRLDFGAEDRQLSAELNSTLRTARRQYAAIRAAAAQIAAQRSAAQLTHRPAGLEASQTGGFVQTGQNHSIGRGTREATQAVDRDGESAIDGANHSTHDRPGDRSVASTEARWENSRPGDARAQPDFAPRNGADTPEYSRGADPANSRSILPFSASPATPPLSEQRGQNWALPTYQPNATAYRRAIRIYCSAKEVVIESQQAPNSRIAIPLESNPVANADRLVHSIWQLMEGWGIAERNGYWKPELQFIVLADGTTTYQALCQLLRGCGFDLATEEAP